MGPSRGQTMLLCAEDARTARRQFAEDVLEGLTAPRKRLPSVYIYDDRGSALFSAITETPEYYPTGCEEEILRTRGPGLARAMPAAPFDLVELGAGDGRKTKILLDAFEDVGRRPRFTAVDVSRAACETLLDRLRQGRPGRALRALVSEYVEGLRWISDLGDGPTVVLFLGSSIGNFDAGGADAFLEDLRQALNPGDMALIGFDLKKPIPTLVAAYNDAAGLTAAFNKNLLSRVNRELGGDFDLDGFDFYSTYDPSLGAVQSYLVSRRRQTVTVKALDRRFVFRAYEAIHTESSFKYTEPDIHRLAATHGFETIEICLDGRRYFADALWRAV